MRKLYFSKRCAWMVPLALAASLFLTAQAPPPTPITDQETELGNSVYKQLKGEGVIIAKSPLYNSLKPVTTTITQAAQPRYEHPFQFYLIHNSKPNAGSVPGGGRLRHGRSSVFREEYRGARGGPLSRDLAHDSSSTP